jgi:hypothetical protein
MSLPLSSLLLWVYRCHYRCEFTSHHYRYEFTTVIITAMSLPLSSLPLWVYHCHHYHYGFIIITAMSLQLSSLPLWVYHCHHYHYEFTTVIITAMSLPLSSLPLWVYHCHHYHYIHFIPIVTTARHWTLFSATLINSTSCHPIYLTSLFNVIMPSVHSSPSGLFAVCYWNKIFNTIFVFPMGYMCHPFYLGWLNHHHQIQ